MRIVGPRLRDLAVEEFHLLALDSQSQVTRDVLITRGCSTARWCIRAKCSGPPSPRRRPASSWCTTIRAATQPLGGRPGGDPPAGGGGRAARHAGVRPCDRGGRPIHQLCHAGIAVNETLLDLAPDFRAALERHADRLDLELIDRALRFSASAHRGQKRMSGEDFVSHSIAVGHDPDRPVPRLHLHRGRAAARRGGGLRRPRRGHRPGIRAPRWPASSTASPRSPT